MTQLSLTRGFSCSQKIGLRLSTDSKSSCLRSLAGTYMLQGQQAPPSIDEVRARVSRMLDSISPDTPIAAIVLFKVDRAKEVQFIENANVLTEATRRLPGVNVFSFHKALEIDDSLEYLIYEDWQTRDLFRTQWDSNHLKRFQYTVGDLVVTPPDLRLYYGWREYRRLQPSGEDGDLAFSLFSMPWQMSVAGVQMMAKMFDPSSWTKLMFDVVRQVQDGTPVSSRRGGCDSDRLSHSWNASPPADQSWPRPFTARPPNGGVQRQPGWGPMPAANTASEGPATATPPTPSFAEPDISPDYPYSAHHVEVYGSKMHYIEAGSGEPILLLHGNPTWSYVWRNIIPHLSSLGHCIGPDLIGYGRSGKPDIRYTWFEHASYLERFIEKLGLKNITLVVHDHGSGLGFHYAMQHPENVKAIAFFEAIVRPFPWDEFSSPQFRELFRQFRSGDVGGAGWRLIVDQNMFVEQLLPQAAGRMLSEREMNYYREPFRQPISRMPIWRLARETPIGGEPGDVWDAVSDYSRKLQRSDVPKLMLYAAPGALLTAEHVRWVQQTWKNVQAINIGPGIHFLQESTPHRIGREIANWLLRLYRV
jgi:haloalkane dehalogenase